MFIYLALSLFCIGFSLGLILPEVIRHIGYALIDRDLKKKFGRF